jgi:hypothetical protein
LAALVVAAWLTARVLLDVLASYRLLSGLKVAVTPWLPACRAGKVALAWPALTGTVTLWPPAVNATDPAAAPASVFTVAVAVTLSPYAELVRVSASDVVVWAFTVTVSTSVETSVGAAHGIVCGPSPVSVPSSLRKLSTEVKLPALMCRHRAPWVRTHLRRRSRRPSVGWRRRGLSAAPSGWSWSGRCSRPDR